jgi:hypothetical protein
MVAKGVQHKDASPTRTVCGTYTGSIFKPTPYRGKVEVTHCPKCYGEGK